MTTVETIQCCFEYANLVVSPLNRALVCWIWGRLTVLDVSVCCTWSLHVLDDFGLPSSDDKQHLHFDIWDGWDLITPPPLLTTLVESGKKLLFCFGISSEMDQFLLVLILFDSKLCNLRCSCQLIDCLFYQPFLQKKIHLLYTVCNSSFLSFNFVNS